jgi:hypothetical protein
VSTEERWARVVLAAQDPQSVADRDTVLRDAMEIGLGLEPGILACSVSELSGAGHRTSVWSSGLALDLDAAQYAADAGPCLASARSGTVELVAGGARPRLVIPGSPPQPGGTACEARCRYR